MKEAEEDQKKVIQGNQEMIKKMELENGEMKGKIKELKEKKTKKNEKEEGSLSTEIQEKMKKIAGLEG